MNNRGRWRLGALASAIALLGSLASLEAHAVALGRITVQSALGEALRAEIDISDLDPEEVASLRIGIASADVFKAAGFDYTAAVAGLDVRLQRRANGKSYLRLTSNRAMNEPFVDLILEAKWSSGRVTRDYTMLFDPPNLRNNSSPVMATPSAPVLSRAPLASAETYPRATAPAAPPRPVARPAPVAAKATPAPRALPAEKMSAGPGATQVTVKPGDNASRIAARTKAPTVSLDQMLVAMLRSNPEAFPGGNINVLKSGAVLDIPDAQTAIALASGNGKPALVAQSPDFNGFRGKLAGDVPAAQVGSADRQAGGKVQAKVEDRAQPGVSPDKLTLSKGAVQGQPASVGAEQAAKDAAELAAKNAAGRAASASGAGPDQSGAVSASSGATAPPGIAAPPLPSASAAVAAGTSAITATPAQAGAAASAPVAGEEQTPVPLGAEPVPAAAKAEVASAPAPAKKPAIIAPPPPEPGLVDQITGNSLLWLGTGGALLALLLGGLAFARQRKNKKLQHVDSSFLDSRLQPDSFFGASGGRRVDTGESNVGGSSIAYSPSQLDAAGDVDPVAEADVYLAYGRDQQAEEILREALRNYPSRLVIHTKLLEILAKRRDVKAFESLARTAFKQSKGQGSEWLYVSQIGRELDPGNPMYQPGAEPTGNLQENGASDFMPISVITPLPAAKAGPGSKNAVDMDLDLDLDLSLDEVPVPASIKPAPPNLSKTASPSPAPAPPSAVLNLDDLDLDLGLDSNLALDLDLDSPAATPSPAPRPSFSTPPPAPAKPLPPEIDFLSEGLDFTPEPFVPVKASTPPAAPITQSGMLEFDMNAFSLDLDPVAKTPPASKPAFVAAESESDSEEDPLEVKFLLAEEFRILGDADGARSLADEVMAKAKGPLKVKAQAFLNSLM